MKWFGLTGGIASGKSTVAKVLKEAGCPVIDADHTAHKALVKESPVYKEVIQVFGRGILNREEDIDRTVLGKIVFENIEKLRALEEIIHPYVQSVVMQERQLLIEKGEKMAFYDVPLAFEKDLIKSFDKIIVVACDEDKQIERLKSRNNLSDEDIQLRLNMQISMDKKVELADYVIWNNDSLEDLTEEVLELIKELKS